MAERLSHLEVPSIRFHHLRLWGEFVEKYTEALAGINPWELSGENCAKAGYFVLDHARVYTNTHMYAREYYEELTLTEGGSSQEDLKYLYDLIGSTQADFDKVLEKRTEAFMKIFTTVSNNKNNLILLSTKPDDICDSCAVGLHCKRTFLQEIIRSDKDFTYMRILQKMIDRYGSRSPLNKGAIGRFGKDTMYISGEILFNPEFYKLVFSEVDKLNKEAWMLHY